MNCYFANTHAKIRSVQAFTWPFFTMHERNLLTMCMVVQLYQKPIDVLTRHIQSHHSQTQKIWRRQSFGIDTHFMVSNGKVHISVGHLSFQPYVYIANIHATTFWRGWQITLAVKSAQRFQTNHSCRTRSPQLKVQHYAPFPKRKQRSQAWRLNIPSITREMWRSN